MVHATGANNPRLRRYVAPDDSVLGENKNGTHWNTPNPGGSSICVHAFIGKSMDDFRKAVAQMLATNKKMVAVHPKPSVKLEPVEKAQPVAAGNRYRVQAGAFSSRATAETLLAQVRSAGFISAYITED